MVTKLMNRYFYIDDSVESVASEEADMEKNKLLGASLANSSLQLTKGICNSENVMKVISPEDRSSAQSKTFEAEPLASSNLGLQWKVKSDSLETCHGMGKEDPAKVTQKNVLSQVCSEFDPLVLFSFLTVRTSLLLKGNQKKHRQSWDDELSQQEEIIFEDWAWELSQINKMAIRGKFL